MKTSILKLLLLISCSYLTINGQKHEDKTLYILYDTKINNLNNTKANNNIPLAISKQMDEAFEIALTFQSELLCSKDQSIFKTIDKLESNNSMANNIAKILFQGDLFYKNQITEDKVKQVLQGGEYINIMIPLDYYKWNITTETKDISGYKCYKATADWIDNDKIRNKQVLRKAIAWFAPGINYSFGPNGLDGLPGIVLEGSKDGVHYFYASKIIFDYKSKNEIEKPKKGVFLTVEEYDDLILKNYKDSKTK